MRVARTSSLASFVHAVQHPRSDDEMHLVFLSFVVTSFMPPPSPTGKCVGVEIRVVKIIDYYHHDGYLESGSDYDTSQCTAKFCSYNSQPRT